MAMNTYPAKQIMIVDDDVHIQNVLSEALCGAGYQILQAYSGTETLLLLEKYKPDLILLDLMLPGLCGEQLLPRIKNIPVIVVSAKVGVDDRVTMLLEGAWDYLTKPFELRELLARIEVCLRKAQGVVPQAILRAGDIEVDTTARAVRIDQTVLKLTKTEYAILKLLVQNQGNVIAKSVILDRISEDTPDCTEASLKQHVSNLRRKLRDSSGTDYIEAVWGIGFRLTV